MKRKTAEQIGATDFVDPNEGDPVAQVQELTAVAASTTRSRSSVCPRRRSRRTT